MALPQTPKTDWTEDYAPSPSDMNRIEANIEANADDIVTEEVARIAGDLGLQDNIDALDTKYEPYQGTSVNNVDYPIGSILSAIGLFNHNRNETVQVRLNTSNNYTFRIDASSGSILSGTWRCRGAISEGVTGTNYLVERVS